MTNVKLLTINYFDNTKYEPFKYIDAIEVHTISFIRQDLASIGQIFGGPTNFSGITQKLEEVKRDAIKKLKRKAIKNGSNLVIGVNTQISQISSKDDGMMVVTISGTAMRKINNKPGTINNKRNNKRNNKKRVNT